MQPAAGYQGCDPSKQTIIRWQNPIKASDFRPEICTYEAVAASHSIPIKYVTHFLFDYLPSTARELIYS